MAIEKLIEKAAEKEIKENLNPNEKLLKDNPVINEVQDSAKLVPDIENAIKISELDVAKNYFMSIGDAEKLKALEGVDEAKRAEAFMEAKEKSVEISDETLKESIEIEDKLNSKKQISFGSYDLFRRRKCEMGKYPMSM